MTDAPKERRPGRPNQPKGTRHKTTLAIEAIFEGKAEALTRKAISVALEGDTTALRLCMERIAPAPKDRPVVFDLPIINGPQDAPAVALALLNAVADGALTPSEAEALTKIVEGYRRAVETAELEARIEKLEATHAR